MGEQKKVPINNIAAVVLVYPASDPRRVFIQRKDDGLPNDFGQKRALCPFGGNWWGPEAASDQGPLDTVLREIREEWRVMPANTITPEIERVLAAVTRVIVPWRAALVTTSAEALGNGKPGFITLGHYFTAGLADEEWELLARLQEQHGRLSNEGNSTIVSVDDIVGRQLRVAYNHGPALRDFFLGNGFEQAQGMYLYPSDEEPTVVDFCNTFKQILDRYMVAKLPPGIENRLPLAS